MAGLAAPNPVPPNNELVVVVVAVLPKPPKGVAETLDITLLLH